MFTVIRKYRNELISNADKQRAYSSREHITFMSGWFSAFLSREIVDEKEIEIKSMRLRSVLFIVTT